MGCIYFVTNLVNGKQYVGKTVKRLGARRNNHYSSVRKGKDGCRLFWRALRKYGFENFEWEEVYSNAANEDLNRLEIECIEWFGTKMPDGYNMTEGGEGTLGHKHSLEQNEKIGKANKGRKRSPETCKKISDIHREKKISLLTRAKISKSLLGRTHLTSLATREKIRKSNTGKRHTQETRKKISEVQIGRKQKLETIMKRINSEGFKNRKYVTSEKTKELLRKRNADPEVKMKQRNARIKYWENKRKQQEAVA